MIPVRLRQFAWGGKGPVPLATHGRGFGQAPLFLHNYCLIESGLSGRVFWTTLGEHCHHRTPRSLADPDCVKTPLTVKWGRF